MSSLRTYEKFVGCGENISVNRSDLLDENIDAISFYNFIIDKMGKILKIGK